MVDFGHKPDFGGCHRVLLRQKEFKFEGAPFEWGVLGSGDDHMEVASVPFIWLCFDPRHRLCQQALCFLYTQQRFVYIYSVHL